jgi:hypothetical protein
LNDEEDMYNQESLIVDAIHYILSPTDSWYYELKYFLTHGSAPIYLEPRKRRSLRLKSTQYHLINEIIFRINYDDVLMRYLEKLDVEKVHYELHDGLARGNFGGDTTTKKILREGYY